MGQEQDYYNGQLRSAETRGNHEGRVILAVPQHGLDPGMQRRSANNGCLSEARS